MKSKQSESTVDYEFLGYLNTLMPSPDEDGRDSVASVTFDASDLAQWNTQDLGHATEWRQVPVRKKATAEGVTIEGDFRDVLPIDSLSPTDPRYWVPLSTVGITDKRLPIDVGKYPIIELTYRCTSAAAHPTWLWTYEGGSHFAALPKTKTLKTVARIVGHFGFPKKVENIVLRLYSPTRTVESFEVTQVRFRAMTKAEKAATKKSTIELEGKRNLRHYPVLDEFMPLGVYMDAESAQRLARMLGISTKAYWELVMDDLVAHHHNAIALAHVDQIDPAEWRDLLALAESHGIRFVLRHEYPIGGPEKEQDKVVADHVAPCAGSRAVFAHSFNGEPIEGRFHDVIQAKEKMEAGDPDHPVALVARYPNAYPLFAPFFSVSGVGHFASRRPWDLGKVVKSHVSLGNAQQFWVAAPAFMYPTQTPEWSTCPEMRLMVNLAWANGARGWFAYSYHNDPVWHRGRVQRTLTGPFLTFSDLWGELAQRMLRAGALAPLYLNARPSETIDEWFLKAMEFQPKPPPAEGISPVSQFQLRGHDYDLYITVSNNLREMMGVDINIPASARKGMDIFDLSEYAQTHQWTPLPSERHIEMFPGQATILLRAKPKECAHWRDVIASRLVTAELRKLQINQRLARAYELNTGPVEKIVGDISSGAGPEGLEGLEEAKRTLLNLLYESAPYRESNSKIIETSAAVCACDGALCRLMARGQTNLAGDLGTKVVPLAREFTKLRLELREGHGKKILGQSQKLSKRALNLLAEIRAEY